MELSLARLKRGMARLADGPAPAPVSDPATLPAGAAEWLRPDNPALIALKARYAAMDRRVTTPAIWDETRLSDEDLLYFRGDNHFVWQVRGPNRGRSNYALVDRHLRAVGHGALLDRLGEDDCFGVSLFEVDGRQVSRDLLDSAAEIDFLRRHAGLGARPLDIIDIGAGYGRLAWRLEQAEADVRVYATDAFAPASFVADHYLRHRDAKRARMVPLDEVEALLAGTPIDLAVNVHSFSECTPDAIGWWMGLLARARVPYLMVVPNDGGTGGARCRTNGGADMEALFARFGYRIAAREPRYADPHVQARGIDPVHLHLFALQ